MPGAAMYQQMHYQHPALEPYSRAFWKEVAYSWAIALIIVAGVLAAI